MITKIGARLLGLFRPPRNENDLLERALGLVVVVFVPLLLLLLGSALPALLIAVASCAIPFWNERRRKRSRADALQIDLLAVADIFELAIAGGANILSAMEVVVLNHRGPVSKEIKSALLEIRAGFTMNESLVRANRRTDGALEPLVRVITDSQNFGIPLRNAIVSIRDELENKLRISAEIRARQTPTLMLFPLVFCIMPAFMLFTIVPIVVSELTQLHTLFR